MHDLNWLSSFLDSLPKLKKRKKSLYEIAGFPHWENVNSNILAFYFDEEEEHGFGRTCFTALLQVLIERGIITQSQLDVFATPFVVERETNAEGKRIDILIRSKEQNHSDSWAIIIENKIYAQVYNQLDVYFNSIDVPKENKIGIVLSPFDVSKQVKQICKLKEIDFHCILHHELNFTIKKALAENLQDIDDRHLLLFKDYVLNIENMNQDNKSAEIEKQLKTYQQHANEIDQLKQLEISLRTYVINSFIKAMDGFGFYPYTPSTSSDSKHFYANNEFFTEQGKSIPEYFRFWCSFPNIVKYRKLTMFFELYDPYAKYGDTLKKHLLTPAYIQHPGFIGTGGGDKYQHNHIVSIQDYDLPESESLQDTFEKIIGDVYFNPKFNIVEECTTWMKNHMTKASPVLLTDKRE